MLHHITRASLAWLSPVSLSCITPLHLRARAVIALRCHWYTRVDETTRLD